MTRITSAAAAWFIATCAIPAQDRLELDLRHVAGGEEIGTSRLLVTKSELRVKADSAGKHGAPGTAVIAIVQRDERGAFRRYDREVRSARDGSTASSVSVVCEDDAVRFREVGSMGSRTKSIAGPPVDVVVDAPCPEILIPYLLDASRKSLRALLLPDLEIQTIVIEERAGDARFAGIPGGGVTLFRDAAGGFVKLSLPGAEGNAIVVPGAASRPANPEGALESRIVLTLDGGVRLGVTLLVPAAGKPPFPGVVLVADAGDRDRDGVGAGSSYPTLRLIAEDLAAAGIATVRADKRGVGESSGPEAGLHALADDARSLVEVLALHPAVDADRVFVAGHGEGAVVATDLAGRKDDAPGKGIAGVVTLASPARPLAEALEARLRLRMIASGSSPETIEGVVESLRAEIETLRRLPESGPVGPGQMLLRDLVRIDPARQIAATRLPLLVIHAGDDLEVPAPQVALMRAALAFSGLSRVRFELVDGAGHDLAATSEASTLSPETSRSSDVARRVHPGIPALIREFCARRAGQDSKPAGR